MLLTFAQSFLEALTLLSILFTINTNAKFGIGRALICAAILGTSSLAIDYFYMPYHTLYSVFIIAASFLILKKPARRSIGNYLIDVILSFVVLCVIELGITVLVGFFSINLLENEFVILIILAALILLFFRLSSNISVHVFFEKYYQPYRITILFSILSLFVLITILVDLFLFNQTLLSVSGNIPFFLIIIGYFVITLLFGISLFRMKRVSDKNTAVMQYGEHLQNVVNEYRALVHDYKHHLQMVSGLNTAKDGTVINRELNEYLEGLMDQRNRTGNTSMIKDDLLLSAMLYQKQELAKQRNIDFDVRISGSLLVYAIPQTELIDILINLIDNALEEAANLDAENRIVHLEFDEDRIEIRNKISVRAGKDGPDNPLHMFEPGYSTKGADRGFGLSNVLSAAERYGIKVHNELRDDYVIFRLNFVKD